MGVDGDSGGAAVGGVAGCEEVSVNIRSSNGSKFSVRIGLDSTVGAFKSLVAQNCNVPADQQRLIYKGRILKDDQTLECYGLQADHTVHMVRGFAPSASIAASGTVNAGRPNPSPVAADSGTSNDGGDSGGAGLGPLASLFPWLGLGGAAGTRGSGLFGSGFPEFEHVQQQLTQNPDMMREIMDGPAIQSLMNNPELMQGLIMSSPQMLEIIDRNPELAHILNDPSILRQTLEATRNPELMREMMRNTDRAMTNMELSPEGFNMLRRMYENVEEPFLNATPMTGDAGTNLSSNPFAALMGNRGAIRHRDGSDNRSVIGSESAAGLNAPNTNPLPNPWSNTGGGTETSTISRSSLSEDARTSILTGLSGLPDMDHTFSGTPDADVLTRLLQNPAASLMMQSHLSNPQYTNQQRLALQQTLLSQLNRTLSNQDSAQTGGATGNADNMGLEMLMNMFAGLGAGGLGAPENSSNVPPEDLYATQLSQLQEMGFFDTQENIRALRAARGNVHAAVERLLDNLGR
ncbi:hypothetical protein Nepgr_025481 [Nepenthes gracilis]|uniref:Ubiquilin n=1 Tax=Nepenthes gracilis TaxID=150966 RepID=A0AAD3XZQ9_NEPGR|nr:hypothetical protein Nepgr_025481 [Nepenthes gracilis]